MTVKELKAYLDKYPDGEEVRFIVADVKKRIAWPSYQIDAKCIDYGTSVTCLDLHECEPMDDEIIQRAEEDERNSMWIPVTEKLPETEEMMLVSCRTKKGAASVNRAYYADGFWHGSGSMSGVTAWMPLPEPYREERSHGPGAKGNRAHPPGIRTEPKALRPAADLHILRRQGQ